MSEHCLELLHKHLAHDPLTFVTNVESTLCMPNMILYMLDKLALAMLGFITD